ELRADMLGRKRDHAGGAAERRRTGGALERIGVAHAGGGDLLDMGVAVDAARQDELAGRVDLARARRQPVTDRGDAFAGNSDPGLHVCREGTRRLVFGIAECAVLTALARGDRFGVIAIAQTSIRRHTRYLRQMNLADRLAGERPLEMSVAETASGEGTLARM